MRSNQPCTPSAPCTLHQHRACAAVHAAAAPGATSTPLARWRRLTPAPPPLPPSLPASGLPGQDREARCGHRPSILQRRAAPGHQGGRGAGRRALAGTGRAARRRGKVQRQAAGRLGRLPLLPCLSTPRTGCLLHSPPPCLTPALPPCPAAQDAGVIAGLNVVRIINEPTAAAIACEWRASDAAAAACRAGRLRGAAASLCWASEPAHLPTSLPP